MGAKANKYVAVILLGIVASLIYTGRRTVFVFIRKLIQSPMLLLGLIVVVAVIVLLGYLIFRLLKSARKKSPAPEAEAAVDQEADADQEAAAKAPAEAAAPKRTYSIIRLHQLFARAMKLLKSNVSGRNYKYQIPWFMLIGEEASEKTAAM